MENYITLFRNIKFLSLLVQIDTENAEKMRRHGRCKSCGSKFHFACYERKIRLPGVNILLDGLNHFFGFCCSNDACRRRDRPPSIRFARGSPNFVGILALIALLSAPKSEKRQIECCKLLGVSAKTLRRWTLFWKRLEGSKWFSCILKIQPLAKSMADLVPEAKTDSVTGWLKIIGDLFKDMSQDVALLFNPQNMADA